LVLSCHTSAYSTTFKVKNLYNINLEHVHVSRNFPWTPAPRSIYKGIRELSIFTDSHASLWLMHHRTLRDVQYFVVTGQNVKKQLCQVILCITEGLELVYNVIGTVLAGYLVRKLAKKVVLKPGTDIDITTLLFNLRSSNSPHNITIYNWLTTFRVHLQNRPACSVGTSPLISPYQLHGNFEGKVSTE